ncbi:MAG: phenylacetate--CoA ligase family protein [bacterium]|nr:phenylacetate--CoA ligase family protein [bacterium]
MKEYQNQKFRTLLHFTWKHSAYYRKLYQDAGITENDLNMVSLSKLPSIDKKQLLEHFDELITISEVTQEQLRNFDENHTNLRQIFGQGIHLVHSSGSTGVPGYFVYDEKAWNTMLIGIVRGALFDLNMSDILKFLIKRPRIAYIAATDGRYGGVMAVGDGIDGIGAKQINLDINTPLDEWKVQLETFMPNIIIGYPTAINILADLMEDGKIHIENVERIVTCGEPLGVGMREHFKEQFGSKILNFYGASESIALGVEENTDEGMLLFDDMNIIEEIDGEMYLTSLYNFAQPLIRYKISDRLRTKDATSNDRVPFTKAFGLAGRNEDILWFEDEHQKKEFLHPLAVEGFCIEGLKDYQFQKLSKNSFEMLAEISTRAKQEQIHSEIICQMRNILKEKGLDFVKFSVRYVHEIKPNAKTGKKTLILKAD